MKYANVIFLQGSEYDEFEKVAYPNCKGVSLGRCDHVAAMRYLMQWEYGEPVSDEVFDDCQTRYPGDIYNSIETDTHVAAWDPAYATAGLWRKIGPV